MIDALIASGVRNKTTIYSKIVEKTGLKRSTIRRIKREYIKDLERKIIILSDMSRLKRVNPEPYYFIPEKFRLLWTDITQKQFKEVKCAICKRQICYVQGTYNGNLVCARCKFKFPNKEKRRNAKRY